MKMCRVSFQMSSVHGYGPYVICSQTIYRLLYAVAPKLAQDTFKAHAAFYHPIARKMIAKVRRGHSSMRFV